MAISHRRIVPLVLPLASVLPSPLNKTSVLWPMFLNVFRSSPVATSHNRIVGSVILPLASVRLSLLKETLPTLTISPVSVFRSSPVAISHNRIVSPPLPPASIFPSPLKEILETVAVFPVSRAIS